AQAPPVARYASFTLAFCLATRRCMNFGPSFFFVGLHTLLHPHAKSASSTGGSDTHHRAAIAQCFKVFCGLDQPSASSRGWSRPSEVPPFIDLHTRERVEETMNLLPCSVEFAPHAGDDTFERSTGSVTQVVDK